MSQRKPPLISRDSNELFRFGQKLNPAIRALTRAVTGSAGAMAYHVIFRRTSNCFAEIGRPPGEPRPTKFAPIRLKTLPVPDEAVALFIYQHQFVFGETFNAFFDLVGLD